MKTKQLLLLLTLLLLGNISYSQTFKYSYDAAGNRIIRELKPQTLSMGLLPDSTIVFTTDKEETLSENESMNEAEVNNGDAFRTVFYPNPTYGIFTLELPEFRQGDKGYVMIYDIMSKLVARQNNVAFTQSFDISFVPSGFYIVRILVNDKMVIKKIIKK